MAYTTIDDPTIYFNTKLYAGNGSTNAISGVGFQSDFVWLKDRTAGNSHKQYDGVRGATKYLISDATSAEATQSNGLTSFDSDGFTLGSYSGTNNSSNNYVSWNWLAGGTAPAITYSVKVVSDSGNKYRFDDFGTSAVTLDLQEGGTYTFDQSDSSNSGHPLRFSTTSNGTHGGGSEYTTGVVTNGTPGSSGAYTRITVAASAPTLYYYCTQHSGMGGQANTNSTFGSSNFSGSIQSTVSANTTTGFSILSYTGTGSSTTVGHGLGVAPSMLIFKNRDSTDSWNVQHDGLTSYDYYVRLNSTGAQNNDIDVGNSAPTSTVVSVGSHAQQNGNGNDMILYTFAEKKGYSKFGSYTGNGNSDGTFVYTGFKVSWVMSKRIDGSGNSWRIFDNKRPGFNTSSFKFIHANLTNAEDTGDVMDLNGNGFKIRTNSSDQNSSGATYIYMAFAESPFVNSNGIPTNAR